jgi:hypothetical protein
MIRLEVDNNKKFMRDSFVIRADEPMRVSVDVTDTGHLIVYGYPGIKDDVEQDPVILYDSESEVNE